MSVYFVGGAMLSAQSSTLIPQIGEQVQLSADVSLDGQLLQISQASAIVRDPDGGVEKIDFVPGGKISTTWTPKIPGTHGVDIVVTSAAPDGSPVERTAFLSVDVQPNPSKLQVTGNLVMVIGLVVLLLGLIVMFFFRGVRKIARRKSNP